LLKCRVHGGDITAWYHGVFGRAQPQGAVGQFGTWGAGAGS